MQFLKIAGAVLLAAICYGIAQDQVTARVCVEYFTIGHPDLFGTDDPTLLGLGWGTVATWWLGLPAGILVAGAARWGRKPKLTLRELLRPMGRVLLCMALSTLAGGIAGYTAARLGWITLVPEYATEMPASRHALFLADGGAHLAAYGSGMLGSVGLAVWAFLQRRRRRQITIVTNGGETIRHE